MSNINVGISIKCPHCNGWIVTPEEAKQNRKRFRKVLVVWTIGLAIIVGGTMFMVGVLW